MLDYRIHTFLTLYQKMNYRKTAEALNMTQPGVTQHIHYLENLYHVKLFEYNGKTLSRTKNAEILKRHVDSVMAETQRMKEEFSDQPGVFLRVGATKTIGEFVLVPAVRRFLKDPSHSIQLIIDNTETLLQKLEYSQLDFAVVEGVFDKSQYGYRLFQKERFVGVCGAKHPFAGKEVPLTDLFSQTLIVREQGSGTRNLLERAIIEKGFSLENFSRVISVSNFSVITEIVANDKAITFAYQPVALHRKDLRTFYVEGINTVGEFNFVYCNQSIGEEKIQLLMKSDI